MRPHAIALIKSCDQDSRMELLTAALLLAILGVLAQIAGADSRDADTRRNTTGW